MIILIFRENTTFINKNPVFLLRILFWVTIISFGVLVCGMSSRRKAVRVWVIVLSWIGSNIIIIIFVIKARFVNFSLAWTFLNCLIDLIKYPSFHSLDRCIFVGIVISSYALVAISWWVVIVHIFNSSKIERRE